MADYTPRTYFQPLVPSPIKFGYNKSSLIDLDAEMQIRAKRVIPCHQ